MSDRQIDEALEALEDLSDEAFGKEVASGCADITLWKYTIRQALERQREEIDALSRLNRALDEKLAEFDGQRVPVGWKLVPVEPTLVMMKYGIGWRELDPNEVWEPGTDKDMVDRIWRAMFAAAPEPADA